jgi:ubiquinone/menaquinone biosynthesis C-methylase UbiE
MSKNFFESKTYVNKEFKGLIPSYYPKKYKQYINEETNLLVSKLKKANRILEAGVGVGRLIPKFAPLVNEFVGVDNSNFMITKSQEVAKDFSNVKIIKEDIKNLSNIFSNHYFDYSLCIWNTLGNVNNPITILKELSKITAKNIFITVFFKETIKDRLEFYKAVDVNVIKINKSDETFFLDGYVSKTFNVQDIENLAKKSGLIVKETKILGEVILFAELTKIKLSS